MSQLFSTSVASPAPSIGGTITGGTTGSVLFVGPGPVFAQDNTNFFWDDTNNRLGIGNNTPAELLSLGLVGTTLGVMSLAGSTAGKITIQPPATTDIWTLTLPSDNGINGDVLITDGAGVTHWGAPQISIGDAIFDATPGSVLFVGAGGILQQDNPNFFYDDTNNRLGIGTNSPGAKLQLTLANADYGVKILAGAVPAANLFAVKDSTDAINIFIVDQLGRARFRTLINDNNVFSIQEGGGGTIFQVGSRVGDVVLTLTGNGNSPNLVLKAGSASQTLNLTEWQNSVGTVLSVVDEVGYVGIGTSAPTTALTFPASSTGITLFNTADQTTNYERGVINWGTNRLQIGTQKGGSGTNRGMQFAAIDGQFLFGTAFGNGASVGEFTANTSGLAATSGSVFRIGTSNYITGNSGKVSAFGFAGNLGPTSGTATMNQVDVTGIINTTGTYVGTVTALMISPYLLSVTGATVNLLDVGSNTGSAFSGTHTSRMVVQSGGNVGIGVTPTAVLHLKSGTATASTAALKFTSGTLLTTAEAGAVEFLTDAYYGTITTGAARKTFAFLESPTFTTPNIGVATATSISNGAAKLTVTASSFTFDGLGNNNANSITFNYDNQSQSNGADHNDTIWTTTFNPSSGASPFYGQVWNYTINQSGTASGSYTALKLNVTETSLLGAAGNLIDLQVGAASKFKVSNAGAVTAPTFISTTVVRLKGYTVATLPAGTQGDTAFVTDALAPAFLAVIVGGGAVITPVFYNGTNWIGY